MEEVKEANRIHLPEELRQLLLQFVDINLKLAEYFKRLAESEIKMQEQREALIATFSTHEKKS